MSETNRLRSTDPRFAENIQKSFIALKVMWSLAFFAATYLTVRFLIESINEYTAYRVFNNINIIRSESLEFPAVKICSLNPTVRNYTLNEFE